MHFQTTLLEFAEGFLIAELDRVPFVLRMAYATFDQIAFMHDQVAGHGI